MQMEEENPFSIKSARRSRAVIGATKEEVKATCAKWCSVSDDGSYCWDLTKLKCLLSHDELEDRLLARNLIHGMILSAQLHPLIFETSSEEDDQTVRLRSLPFFDQLLAENKNGVTKYQSLSDEQKLIVAVGVRDLYLGAWHGILSKHEKRILDGMVMILDETVGCIQAMGMNISFHPSTTFKVVKLVEALDDEVGFEWAPLFAQVMHTPRLFAVFVDPAELSYHNLENIIPLDRWVQLKLEEKHENGLSLTLTNAHKVHIDREVFTCKLQGPACHLVRQLPSIDLFVTPLNKATRGGERFIFHSTLLSKALSEAVRSSNVLSKLAQGRLTSSFEFVNYVFRCNRFTPGDSMFASHLDTPYYDRVRSQVSKYTLLIYLTTGYNKPSLRMHDVELDDIEEMTCVIFDQSYEHEGKPFIEGEKIFIRSELVFQDKELSHNSQIASLFSEACYMTSQSVFDKDLTSYAHECYERANSLHWALEQKETLPPAYLHKQFCDLSFLTNGYNYWFAKGGEVNVVDCGMVAVLDYFNCKIDGQPFRSMCCTTTVRGRFDNLKDIWTCLWSGKTEKAKGLRRLKETDVESLFKKGPDKPFVVDDGYYDHYCPKCYPSKFNFWDDSVVQMEYKWCCDYTRRKIFGVPLLVLNRELVVNESNIKVVGDKIFFLTEPNGLSLPSINFAACLLSVDELASELIEIDQEISAPKFLIPPIMFREFEEGYQLMLDFFRNDWMVQVDDTHTIPVPIITVEYDECATSFQSRISN